MNHWEKNHGKARRAIDRALLKECEKQIEIEEQAEARARIARAFGRLDTKDCEAHLGMHDNTA